MNRTTKTVMESCIRLIQQNVPKDATLVMTCDDTAASKCAVMLCKEALDPNRLLLVLFKDNENQEPYAAKRLAMSQRLKAVVVPVYKPACILTDALGSLEDVTDGQPFPLTVPQNIESILMERMRKAVLHAVAESLSEPAVCFSDIFTVNSDILLHNQQIEEIYEYLQSKEGE